MDKKNLSGRLDFLDGLRGLAALVVVFGHFWPYEFLRMIPLVNLVFDTKLAVAIFFVLSGVVLSRSASNYNNDTRWLLYSIIARYIRLMVPILLVTGVVLVLFECDLFFTDGIPKLFDSWEVWKIFYRFEHDLLDGVFFSLFNVFFNYDPSQTYIPPAWTMKAELLGSVLLFLFIWLLSFFKINKVNVSLIIIGAVVLFFSRYYVPALYYFAYFLVGFGINILYSNSFNGLRVPLWVVFLWALVKSLFSCASLSYLFSDFIFAAVLVFLVMANPEMKAFFSKGFFTYLGFVSFPLYLIHSPVIASFGLYNFIWMSALGFSEAVGSVVNFILVLTVVFFFSHILARIDQINLTFLRRLRLALGFDTSR